MVPIPTRAQAADRHACVGDVMAGGEVQAKVHDLLVRVYDGDHCYTYSVFFKNHARLSINKSIRGCPRAVRGDVVVMRLGTKTQVVNMVGRDAALSDRLVHWSVLSILLE